MIAGMQATLPVADVPRAVAFYVEALGFEFRGYFDPIAGAVVPTWDRDVQPAYAEVFAGPMRIGFRPAERIAPTEDLLALYVRDLAETHRKLAGRAAQLTRPTRQPWGAMMFTFADPDGHRWGVLEARTG
jgi:predicted enzyme related to lactoylglutathione lyase